MSNNNTGTIPGFQSALGYVQLSVTTVVGVGTPPTYARTALIRTEGAAIRYRDDGTNPTSSVGMPLNVGDVLVYTSTLSNLKIVSTSGTAVVNIAYYD